MPEYMYFVLPVDGDSIHSSVVRELKGLLSEGWEPIRELRLNEHRVLVTLIRAPSQLGK